MSLVPSLLPPPEDVFDTKNTAMKFAQDWAEVEGYAVVTYASAKGWKYVYLKWDKGGTYRSTRALTPADRQPKTSSAKIDCKFRARITVNKDGLWALSVQEGTHSGHEPSASRLSHAIQRRFDALTTEDVLDQAKTGSRPRQIVVLLQERNPPLLKGRPPAEALLDWLQEQEWPFVALTADVDDHTERLQGLLFSHPQALKLLRRFDTVIVIDATYSTNKNRLPLLHFVGITSSNRSFTAALAFLPDETTLTYQWALDALSSLAPDWRPQVVVTDEDAALGGALMNKMPEATQILCQWHIRQNMQKRARKQLPDDATYELLMSDFDEVRDARTLDRLTEARNTFFANWEGEYPKLCEYLDEKLSAEHLWVSAYINRHPHMGTKVTSRAEGAHATLKNWLSSRHGSLFTVTQALKNHFVVQHGQINSDLENDREKIPISILGDPFFFLIAKNVSRFALNLLKIQDEISHRPANKIQLDAEGNLPPPPKERCDCILPVSMGLPCYHELAILRATGRPIPIESIHVQWLTAEGLQDKRPGRLFDPFLPDQRKIALAKAAEKTSTGCILAGAELAEKVFKRKQRHCKNCHQTGHNSAKCPLPCGHCKGDHQLGSCPLY